MAKPKMVCSKCGEEYAFETKRWHCKCGGYFDIEFEPSFPRNKIRNRLKGQWRYREAIPIHNDSAIVSFNEGFTPLTEIEYGGAKPLVKLDYLFPTGSFKDRGATVLMSHINEIGVTEVVEDSSGNSAVSLAAYASLAGIVSDVYVPLDAPSGKLLQAKLYGANVHIVRGFRKDAAIEAKEAAKKKYYASHHKNPFFYHGTKTFAYEVCEQLGWNAPEAVLLPIGSGSMFTGAYLGFRDLRNAGVIDTIPRMNAVQSERCKPVADAFEKNRKDVKEAKVYHTIADGMRVSKPGRGDIIMEAIRETGGTVVTVSDEEVMDANLRLCRKGLFVEPTSATAFAALKKGIDDKVFDAKEQMLTVLTSMGLKAPETITKFAYEVK